MRIDAVHALFPEKILRQDQRARRRLQGHGQARALAAGAFRLDSARSSSTASRTISRSCPTHSRRSRPSPRPRPARRVHAGSSMTASPNSARRKRTISPAGSRTFRSMRPTPAWPRPNAPSRRRAWRADLHQRHRQTARPAAIPAVLEEDERARQADWLHPARGAECRTISTRRSRSTRSGGRSAGPTRPRPRWCGWCSPRSWTPTPTSRSSRIISAASCRCWKAASARAGRAGVAHHGRGLRRAAQEGHRLLAHPMALGHRRHRVTIRLSQDPDDLLFRELRLLHPASSRRPVSQLIDGPKTRGQVVTFTRNPGTAVSRSSYSLVGKVAASTTLFVSLILAIPGAPFLADFQGPTRSHQKADRFVVPAMQGRSHWTQSPSIPDA